MLVRGPLRATVEWFPGRDTGAVPLQGFCNPPPRHNCLVVPVYVAQHTVTQDILGATLPGSTGAGCASAATACEPPHTPGRMSFMKRAADMVGVGSAQVSQPQMDFWPVPGSRPKDKLAGRRHNEHSSRRA